MEKHRLWKALAKIVRVKADNGYAKPETVLVLNARTASTQWPKTAAMNVFAKTKSGIAPRIAASPSARVVRRVKVSASPAYVTITNGRAPKRVTSQAARTVHKNTTKRPAAHVCASVVNGSAPPATAMLLQALVLKAKNVQQVMDAIVVDVKMKSGCALKKSAQGTLA